MEGLKLFRGHLFLFIDGCLPPQSTFARRRSFFFGKVRFGVKTHDGLKHCLFLFLLLEMCAFSTEDAYTRLAAEDTCNVHTLSKHENHLRNHVNDKKREKVENLFLNGKTLLIYYWIQGKNLWDNNRTT